MADNNQFVQGKPSYSLTGNGVSSSDTSVTVSDFTLPDGTNITMSMFGDTGYGTFEPGTSREENVSFTGVTQNGNGTATLTGVTRGLRFVAPYTADSGLAKGHGGNTPFVLSNSAPFYNELSGKDNDETITGTWTFTSPNYPRIDDADNVATLDPQFVTKKMLDDTAFAGANLNKVVVPGVAGETVAENDILYFDETDEEWKLADATFVNQESYLIGLAMGAGTDGNGIDGGVMLEGVKGSFTGLSAGEPIFLSDTAGEISTSAGTIQVELGYVQTASTTEILFFPKFKSYLLADTKDALNNPTSGGTLSSTNTVVDDDDTATTSTADKVVRGNSDGLIDGSWLAGETRVETAGETINGATLPVACYLDDSDGEWYACDADDISKLEFTGFAISNGTDGNDITIQYSGIVSGFSGLTTGAEYYVQDDGTLGLYPGTYRVLAGVAISTNEILIIKKYYSLFERASFGENGLFVAKGRDMLLSSSNSGSDVKNYEKLTFSANTGGTANDEGRAANGIVPEGTTSGSTVPSYDLGCEMQADIDMFSIVGNNVVIQFIGFAPYGQMTWNNTTDEIETTKHIGFYWVSSGGGSQTWDLFISNADGSTQTVTEISGYADPFTRRLYKIENDTNEIRFYIDNELVGTHTTNIPTGDMETVNNGMHAFNDGGSGDGFNTARLYKQKTYWIASY